MSNSKGIFQQKDGTWGYRFVITVKGQRIDKRKTTDENGKKLLTEKQALKAKEKAIKAARKKVEDSEGIVVLQKKTVREVYEEFCENGRRDRAYQTKRKQDSLWENHLKDRYGSRNVNSISVAEINDYLAELYYKNGLSYRYTESFLKMFYLIFGQAYSRNYLDLATYNKLCKNKDTRIHMPKLKDEDDMDIVAFSRDELEALDEYFEGTNAETAYLLGRYCGLRINECYGLKWDHIHFEEGFIDIDRQMMYQDCLIKLVPVKTRNGRRQVYLCQKMKDHLEKKYVQKQEDERKWAAVRAQKQRFITDLDGTLISSTEMVNCLPNGTLQTVNSFKYPSREIRKIYGMDFKYHYLRHTYGTMMAELNTPQHLLCNQMGHGNIHVTQLYYLAVTKTGIDILQDNLNKL